MTAPAKKLRSAIVKEGLDRAPQRAERLRLRRRDALLDLDSDGALREIDRFAPDGRVVVVVGQASHRLSRYAIDAASGALSLVASQPVGRSPNWVEIVELAC